MNRFKCTKRHGDIVVTVFLFFLLFFKKFIEWIFVKV